MIFAPPNNYFKKSSISVTVATALVVFTSNVYSQSVSEIFLQPGSAAQLIRETAQKNIEMPESISDYFDSVDFGSELAESLTTPITDNQEYAENLYLKSETSKGTAIGCLLYTSPSPRDR